MHKHRRNMTIAHNEINLKQTWLRCPNSECQYAWPYSGRFLYYATCPSCRRNVKIQENKIESPQSVQVGTKDQIAAVANAQTSRGADE
jgi:Zn ribbon nucleic-acid-binding protein